MQIPLNGFIKMTSPDRGFGFIKVEGVPEDVFFHAKDLRGVEFVALKRGDKVKVERIETNPEKGKNIARGVSLA